MTFERDICDIISIFHDGTISAYSGDKDHLTMTVDCQYLAEQIDSRFDKFFIQLTKVEELDLTTWPRNKSDLARTLTELDHVFKADLEILNVNQNEKGVKAISCLQLDPDFDYSGGDLRIIAEEIRIFDQSKNEISVDQLLGLAKKYWESF